MSEPPKGRVVSRSKWARALDVISWAALLGLLLHLLLRDGGGPDMGSTAPVRRLERLDGMGVSTVPDLEHKRPTLIKAIASWCGACRRSVSLEALTDLHTDYGLDFVTVSVDDDIEDAREAQSEWPIRGTVLFDRAGAFSRDHAIRVLPTYILLDETGRVERVTTGLPGPLDFKAWRDAGAR